MSDVSSPGSCLNSRDHLSTNIPSALVSTNGLLTLLQAVPDFQTPFIVDDSFDPSTFVGEYFGDHFQEGLLAKSDHFPSMSSLQKASQRDMLAYHPGTVLHDSGAYSSFPQAPYGSHTVYHPSLSSNAQDADFQYVPGHQYDHAHTFQHERPAVMHQQSRQASVTDSYHYPEQAIKRESSPQYSRKRKASPSMSEYDLAPPQKKHSLAQVHVQDPNGDYYDFSGQTSPYSPFVPTPTAHQLPTVIASPRPSGHHHSTSTASQVSLAAPSPHTPAFSPSFATVKTEPSPRAPLTPIPRPASTSSPLKSSVPKLVRTSTIQQSPPGLHSSMGPIHVPGFNPYAMYPLKANLKLQADLDSMTKDWTADEFDARRRLVEFKRTQSGSTINADFKPVAPQDRSPSSITISCIFWKEKKEYYVTSVDTIYLLEALVGVRFTVEEKNRIRRNLEGFRPATVSKSKLDSEEFFKVIMGFPHPKPRNIEKDVKVFPWKILSHALKKIISKYSASYSSTASALLTPAASGYASTESSTEYTYPPSPHPEYAPVSVGHPYQGVTMVGYPSGHMAGPMSVPVTSMPHSGLQVQVPVHGPGYDMQDPYGFASMPGMPHASLPMVTQAMSAPAVRQPASWDYANYVHESPSSLVPNSAPPVNYGRGPIDTAEFVTPTNYN